MRALVKRFAGIERVPWRGVIDLVNRVRLETEPLPPQARLPLGGAAEVDQDLHGVTAIALGLETATVPHVTTNQQNARASAPGSSQ